MEIFLPDPVRSVLNRLNRAGHEAYIVGGCVRDSLLGLSPKDYDVTTSALPEETARLFPDCRVIETGIRHGTVTVILDGMPIEITTYRTDGVYTDSRRPDEVFFVKTLKEDLARRDFTMNALAYNPKAGLVDLFGGQADIEAGLIRCVGEPELRFTEDALRILRAVRFASQLGFTVEKRTQNALFACRARLIHVSVERIVIELMKLLCGKNVRTVLLEYVDILGVPLPELLPMVGCVQDNPHHIYDVYTHSVVVTESMPLVPHLRFAALLHDVGKPSTHTHDEDGIGHFYGHGEVSLRMVRDIMNRMHFDNPTFHRVSILVKYHDAMIQPTERVVKRWLSRISPEAFFELLLLKRGDALGQAPDNAYRLRMLDELYKLAEAVLESGQCFQLADLTINGDDLLALGFSQGPEIGKTLDALLMAVIDGELPNERPLLTQKALELLQAQGAPKETE